eukprot:TRINITY_DN4379_c0_g1_i12.p1 TRINITY_DN4379_c0_g1~~TRINITY_DN4379_c0_g1_i12.p1  ORF type:complete len:181 (+),score=33.17 TRINITY_DN4379_c0_g1_i12:235-777(+)
MSQRSTVPAAFPSKRLQHKLKREMRKCSVRELLKRSEERKRVSSNYELPNEQSMTAASFSPDSKAIPSPPSASLPNAVGETKSGGKKYFTIRNKETNRLERFKLFYERELPQFEGIHLQVKLHDPLCDNDCDTEKEEVDISLRYLENELSESLAQYMKGADCVRNLRKYQRKTAQGNKAT